MPVLFVLIFTVLVNFSSFAMAQERTTKIRGPRGSDVPPAPLTVGPLSPSDTLWRVAERIKPDGNISLYQVMYALYLKNPEAFLENNLNHLRPGAVLVLPTLQEIQQVDLTIARNKSEQDDRNWAERQKNAAAKQAAAAADKQVQSVDESQKVQQQLQQELTRIDQQQRLELDSLRSQFADSMQQVEAIVTENQQLKTSLTKVEQELALIKSQLGEDSELQQQMSQLLAQQSELLKAKEEQDAKAAEGTDWMQWFKSPVAWVLAACIPALLALFGILLWVKSRSRRTEEVVSAAMSEPVADPSYQSPLPPLEDNNELDDSLFEIDDALLEDAFSDGSDLAEQDLTDDLHDLDDALSFEDDSLLPPDNQENKTSEPEADAIFDPDNILSDTDLSALLAAEDDDDVVIELADELDADVPSPKPLQAETDDSELSSVQAPLSVDETDNTAAQILDDEFDVDELIEEIDLDEPDEPLTSELSLQSQQLAQSLAATAVKPVDEEEKSRDDDTEFTESTLADATDSGQFDSSELEEFAESLVAEQHNTSADSLDDELSSSEEALLSAELAELLDQVQDTLAEPTFVEEAKDEPVTEEFTVIDHIDGIQDGIQPDELLDVSEPEEADGYLAAMDLTDADDASVVPPTDAVLSVENPSQILEQYPELDLEQDEADSAEADFALPQELETELLLTDPDELSDLDELAELAEPEESLAADPLADDPSNIELDPMPDSQFDSLMSELEAMADNLDTSEPTELTIEEQPQPGELTEESFDFGDEDFVEIDSLLANAEQQGQDTERFNQLNVDVGLEDYADIIGEHERRDVDREDNGYSAKLDLVRAYIEIDDHESAELLLDDILASEAPDNVKAEAKSLKQ